MSLGEFDVVAVVDVTRNALAANLEVKLLRLGLLCLGVLAWVYLTDGELRVSEAIPPDAGGRAS